jgi:hypothetical protein
VAAAAVTVARQHLRLDDEIGFVVLEEEIGFEIFVEACLKRFTVDVE